MSADRYAVGGLVRPARRHTAPRALVIIQNLPFRIDRRVRSECRELVGAGYGVTVVCPKETEDEPNQHEIDGVTVRSYAPPPQTSDLVSYATEFVVCWWRAARLSVRAHRNEGFDIIQACNPPDTYWLLALLWKLCGKRFIYDQHDLSPELYEARFGRRGLLHRLLLVLERATYAVADRVVSPNPSYQEVATGRGGVPVERTAVVMSTPDPSTTKRGEAHPELRHGREHLVCYVGIMGPQDGVDGLLEAISLYVLCRSDTHFALLGYGDSLDQLRAMSTQLGIDGWTTFTGRVDHDELGRWLSTADVGVTPDPPCDFNHRSTMNKTLEYMAHEVPVVATDLRETRRCAGKAAEYVLDGDPALMAKTIAALLDDPVRRSEMGRVGRQRIENELAWSIQARAYLDLYAGLVGSARSSDPAHPGEEA
jgi:glycosyltransferase involved in cell wall biosynthesis